MTRASDNRIDWLCFKKRLSALRKDAFSLLFSFRRNLRRDLTRILHGLSFAFYIQPVH